MIIIIDHIMKPNEIINNDIAIHDINYIGIYHIVASRCPV